MRITTNGTLLGYKSNLMNSSNTLNTAQNRVLSQRNFSAFAEDPAAATQAFKLRRSFSRTADQINNNDALTKKYQSAWDALSTVKSDLLEKMGKVSALAGVSDDKGAGRQPLAAVLKSAAESAVQAMNSQYGSSFIFGGKDSLSGAPFELKENADGSHALFFRGIDVDSKDPDDMAKLKEMNAEKVFVDLGAGMTEVDGEMMESTVFNGALSGIEYLGYGADKDGDPKNAITIMTQISDIFARCDKDSGAYASDGDKEDAMRLTTKLQGALDNVTNKWTELDGDSSYLTSNGKRLTLTADNLNEQILGIEQVDLGRAITDLSWAQYCYNAALKVGNSILSQSLIDYMN